MLTFNLKKEWFEKIKSGEKTHEYREVKPYWSKRLLNYMNHSYSSFPRDKDGSFLILNIYNKPFDLPIEFVCGYAGKDDSDKRLKGLLKTLTVRNGKDTDLAIDKEVYDIEFELVKEGWEDD